MKILCPTDFSIVSVNAIDWTSSFLESLGGGEICLLHVMSMKNRSNMFSQNEDLIKQTVVSQIEKLASELNKKYTNINFTSLVTSAETKEYIVSYASYKEFDWIALGSKGLTALKNITVGSVAEYCIEESKLPLIVVPENTHYDGIEKMIVGVDEKLIKDTEVLTPIISICNLFSCSLDFVHIKNYDDDKTDEDIELNIPDLDYTQTSLYSDGDISKTLNDYSVKSDADLFCMVHYKLNWFKRLFNRSLTKQELFDFKKPLLILKA